MPAFQCTSPVRQRDEEILYPIPHDVYYDIFDYLDPGGDLTRKESKDIISNMALVCKFFYSVALPKLFSSLHIYADAHGGSRGSNYEYSHFWRDVMQGQELARSLASHVKTISIKCTWQRPVMLKLYFGAFLEVFFQAIIQMHHIETLNLHGIPLNKSFWKALCDLPQLKCLSIIGCPFAKDLRAAYMQDLYSLQLPCLELKYNLVEIRQVIQTLGDSNDPIFTNAFNLKHMKVLRTDVGKVVYQLSIQEEALASLEELELYNLNEEDLGLLNTALPKLPCLTRLCLHKIELEVSQSDSNLTTFSLCPSAIPKTLKSIVCPPFMLPTFISHQPLESLSLSEVEIFYEEEFLELTGQYEKEMLPYHSEFIRCLAVPPSFCFAVPFGEHFPRLEELHILYSHRNYKSVLQINEPTDLRNMMAQFSEAWSQPLMIRSLRFSFEGAKKSIAYLDLPVQHDIVTTILSKVFPNLKQFSAVEHLQWIRDSSASQWKPFVPAQDRDFVRRLLTKDGLSRYVDYDGCFKSILE